MVWPGRVIGRVTSRVRTRARGRADRLSPATDVIWVSLFIYVLKRELG